VLTAKIPGCVVFSLPVQRRSLQSRRIQRLSGPFGASAARGWQEGRFQARAAPLPGQQLVPGTARDPT